MQYLVALSSAESELYCVVKATSEALWLRSVLHDLGKVFPAVCIAMQARCLELSRGKQGLGKLRHIDCNFCSSSD